MKIEPRIPALIMGALIALFSGPLLFAQEAQPAEPAQTSLEAPAAPEKPDSPKRTRRARANVRPGRDNQIVTFGSDIHVRPGETVREAVAIIGDVNVEGETQQAVAVIGSVTASTGVREAVSIVGSTRINAGAHQAVAVVGNVYVNSHVTGDVVAVGGGVELGPEARVDGQVVSIGGPLKRDASASIGGQVVQLKVFNNINGFSAWVTKALAKGRPLAFGPGLAWAWMVAGIFLACYLITALLAPKAVTASAEVLEQRPGGVLLAAFLTVIISPIISLLLAATVVGAVVWIAFSIALAFVAKAAFMAWIGRRATNPLGITHPALAVLLGGVALALLYCVPVLGILMWKLSGFIGAGMAVYAAILAIRRRRAERDAKLAAEKTARDAANPPAPGAPPLPPQPASGAHETAGVLAPRAGFWIRTGALMIDFVMIAIIAAICHIGAATLPLFAVYCIVMWALRATTIGGIVCGLKIARLDGRPVDWATAIVRALGGFLFIGFFWVLVDDERQAWHDKIAGTVVVHAPKGQSLV